MPELMILPSCSLLADVQLSSSVVKNSMSSRGGLLAPLVVPLNLYNTVVLSMLVLVLY